MAKKKGEDVQSAEDVLLGTGAKFDMEGGGHVIVQPLGITHVKRFSGAIAKIVSAAMRFFKEDNIDMKAVGAVALPIVMSEAIELVEACCVCVDCEWKNLPHWEFPPIAEAWIEMSFGPEKAVAGWIKLVEAIVRRFAGDGEFSISETLSSFLRPPATPPQTS